jgi:hypothetical protein
MKSRMTKKEPDREKYPNPRKQTQAALLSVCLSVQREKNKNDIYALWGPKTPAADLGITSSRTLLHDMAPFPMGRPHSLVRLGRLGAREVHEESGRLAAPAAAALLLPDPLEAVVLVLLLPATAVDVDHQPAAGAAPLADLSRVPPECVLLGLGDPSLDQDELGVLRQGVVSATFSGRE